MDIEYLAVTRGSTILACCAAGDGDFDVITNEILTSSEIKNPRIQIDKGGHRFFILHDDKGLNVVISCSPETESGDAFGVLKHVYRSFLVSFSSEWMSATAYSLQREFEPQLRQTIDSHTSSYSNSLNPQEDSSAIVMSALESSILSGDSISTRFEQDKQQLNLPAKRGNLKLKMFVKKYKWLFAILILLFVILIILIILLITTE